jgi:hypothetical protein
MPSVDRQVKIIKEAINNLATEGNDKEATSLALTEIQDYVQEAIDNLVDDADDND